MREQSVCEARDRFLARNGFDMSSYQSPVLPLHIGRLTWNVRNPGLLQWHDLHHVATGFGTTFPGEIATSVFELRAGCSNRMVFWLCLGALMLGMLRIPRAIARIWRCAAGARTLYADAPDYDTLLAMTVSELRDYLRLPPEGLAALLVQEK